MNYRFHYLRKSAFIFNNMKKLFIYFVLTDMGYQMDIWEFNDKKTDAQNWENFHKYIKKQFVDKRHASYAPLFIIPDAYAGLIKTYKLKLKK